MASWWRRKGRKAWCLSMELQRRHVQTVHYWAIPGCILIETGWNNARPDILDMFFLVLGEYQICADYSSIIGISSQVCLWSRLVNDNVSGWSMKACWEFQVTASTLFEDGGNYIALLIVFTHHPKIELYRFFFWWDFHTYIYIYIH